MPNARATTIMTDAADGVHVIFATMFRTYQCELADKLRGIVRQTHICSRLDRILYSKCILIF